ncbi:hypothetical protein BU16DRAFT_622318 [Lophium mytilinum]|uniref:Uncharacterized protein n=1 Tax=Lophium mytilinum TaxID=390894 RepID=A0A6A6QDX2_9PEZI|nr:hypothetical protein BU16DRAFT_622318 [Lophium mytilinum]
MESSPSYHTPVYETIAVKIPQSKTTDECVLRSDDSGKWNAFEAWYLFLLHAAACGFFVLSITIWVDENTFHTGSPPFWFQWKSGLYQTQVAGLISIALVARSITGRDNAPEQLASAYLPRTRFYHANNMVGMGDGRDLFAMAVRILRSTCVFSVAWLPWTRLLEGSTQTSLGAIVKDAYWNFWQDMETSYLAVVSAAAMTGKDPLYAFNPTGLPLRRYFDSTHPYLTTNSSMSLTVPYFDVNLTWVNHTVVHYRDRIGNSDYIDVNNNSFVTRDFGAVAIMQDKKFYDSYVPPEKPEIFSGHKLVYVKLQTLNSGERLEDGTIINNSTACPRTSDAFGKLPAVSQFQVPYVYDNDTWAANYCYIVANASILAGKHNATDCIASPDGSIDRYATCTTTARVPEDDWLTCLSLDYMSEVMKYTVMQKFTQPYLNRDITQYTSGMLTLGYHAAWSGLMKNLGNDTESASFRRAESVVQSQIARAKLYGWLGMNMTLALSAVLVYIAQRSSATKTVRDTAIAAMTMDLTEVMHSGRANGLCNAVALSERDSKLPKLKWKGTRTTAHGEMGTFEEASCRQRLVFVDEIEGGSHGIKNVFKRIQTPSAARQGRYDRL